MTNEIKPGDKVRSNGRYRDVHAKLGDTVQTVKYVGTIPSYSKQMLWLECGGGGFCADGFDIVFDTAKGGAA